MLRATFDQLAGALGCATDYQCEQLSGAMGVATLIIFYGLLFMAYATMLRKYR